jgi:hypothetical protein
MPPISGANMRKPKPVIVSTIWSDVSEHDDSQIRSDQ